MTKPPTNGSVPEVPTAPESTTPPPPPPPPPPESALLLN